MIEIFKSDVNNKLNVITEDIYTNEAFDIKDCWINLVNPSDKEVALISQISGIEDDTIKAALDSEERSRIEVEDDYALILVDIPVIEEEDDYYSYFTIPLGMIVKNNVMITVCLKDSSIIRDFVRNRIKGFSTLMKSKFTFQILANVASKFIAYLKQIDKASQRIQNELHKSTRNKELIQMLDLENSLLYFSTSLTGNDAVITKIMNSKGRLSTLLKIYEEDSEILEDVSIETKQAIEMSNIYRNIVSSTAETYESVISNNLNTVMKTLTSVTIIISTPALIATIWGINTWVPWQLGTSGEKIGFFVVVGICILSAVIAALIMKKNKLL